MSEICAQFIPDDVSGTNLGPIAKILDQYPKQIIANLLWSVNGYKPEVNFVIAYTNNSILLKYTVTEKYISAIYRQTNDPVYNDTCVEVFIAFDSDAYYNLEFNCMGTALVGYGWDKQNRTNLNAASVNLIKTHHVIKTSDNSPLIAWQLTLNIPFSVFMHHNITSLHNRVCKMNFYKCGDGLPEPHFLSWNNIISPEPNFHLPQFFGDVRFVP